MQRLLVTDSEGGKLRKAEKDKMERDLSLYIIQNFQVMFEDEGALALMTPDIENNDESSLDDLYDTKYGSGVAIIWRSADTAAATELAKKIKGLLRDNAEGEDVSTDRVTNQDWCAMVAFELRVRLALEKKNDGVRPPRRGAAVAAAAAAAAAQAAAAVKNLSPTKRKQGSSADSENGAKEKHTDARDLLAGPAPPAKDGEVITEESIRNFLQKHPERAISIAKVATDFQSPNSGVKSLQEANDKEPSPSSKSVERLPVVTDSRAQPRRSLPSLDGISPGKRVSVELDSQDEVVDLDDDQDRSRKHRKVHAYRAVQKDNSFAELFPLKRTGTFNGMTININQACMLVSYSMFGPFQKEDKHNDGEHGKMVSSLFLKCMAHSLLMSLNPILFSGPRCCLQYIRSGRPERLG